MKLSIALALIIVALKGEGLEKDFIEKLIADYEVNEYFSPLERAFIDEENPEEFDSLQFSWRYEGVNVLFWALGIVEVLSKPTGVCDVVALVSLFQEKTAEEFRSFVKKRSVKEILDQADLIYRYHWAVVDASLHGKEPPADLDGGVVMERHHALNWLICYGDTDWDEVTTDT